MTAQPVALQHPLQTSVQQLKATVRQMVVGGWDGLDEDLARDLSVEMAQIVAMLSAHRAAASRVIEDSGLAKRAGAASTAALLAADFGGDASAGHRMVRTGQALAAAPGAEEALASGRLSERQANVVARAAATVPTEHRERVEAKLIAEAQDLRLKDLERRADQVSDVYKPPAEADADENAIVEAREQRDWAASRFRMWDRHDGTHQFEGVIPEAQADVLRTTLQALIAPRRTDGDVIVSEAPTETRMGQAFAQLAGQATPETLINGGPTLVVTTDLETLQGKLKVATMETGTRLSASQARRLACHAKILPAVMNGASVILDHGRTKRLFTPNQRIALAHRDQGCAYPGCDRPPAWCEAHHWRQKWSDGGTTDLADGVLLCGHHHRLVHSQNIEARQADDGVIEFRPPGQGDWRRNRRYRT